jgi:MFS transporter, DHA1 family, tetracycline resistance protein
MSKQKTVLLLTVFIDMVCFSMFFPVMPYLVKEMHLPDFSVGAIVSVFALLNFVCASFWGGISDRKGRRPVMLLSIAITFFANLLLAVALNAPVLFLARALAGIGSANISVAQAYMADISSPEERTKNMGVIGAMFGLGFIAGPPIGGWLKHLSGEGTALWVGLGAAALNLVNLLSAYWFLQESNTNRQPVTGAYSFNPFKPILKWMGQSGRPVINRLMLLFFLYVAAFSMMQITSGLLWKEKYHLTEQKAGYVFAFIGITSAIFQGALVGRLSKRYNSRQLIIAGALLMAAGLSSFPLPPVHAFLPWELLACAVLSLGNALITPAVTSWLSREAPPGEIGQVLGANQSFSSMARVIGPPVGTGVFSLWFSLPFFISGLLMILPFFIILSLKKNSDKQHSII